MAAKKKDISNQRAETKRMTDAKKRRQTTGQNVDAATRKPQNRAKQNQRLASMAQAGKGTKNWESYLNPNWVRNVRAAKPQSLPRPYSPYTGSQEVEATRMVGGRSERATRSNRTDATGMGGVAENRARSVTNIVANIATLGLIPLAMRTGDRSPTSRMPDSGFERGLRYQRRNPDQYGGRYQPEATNIKLANQYAKSQASKAARSKGKR